MNCHARQIRQSKIAGSQSEPVQYVKLADQHRADRMPLIIDQAA